MKKLTSLIIALIISVAAMIFIFTLSNTVASGILYEKAASLLEKHD